MATSDIKDDNTDIKKLFEEIKTTVTQCLNSMDLQKAKLDIFIRDIKDHPEKLYDLDGENVQEFLKETIERCQSLSLKDTELINKLEAIQNLFPKTVQRRENGGRGRDSGYVSGATDSMLGRSTGSQPSEHEEESVSEFDSSIPIQEECPQTCRSETADDDMQSPSPGGNTLPLMDSPVGYPPQTDC